MYSVNSPLDPEDGLDLMVVDARNRPHIKEPSKTLKLGYLCVLLDRTLLKELIKERARRAVK